MAEQLIRRLSRGAGDIPDLAVVVVVAGEEQAAAVREGDCKIGHTQGDANPSVYPNKMHTTNRKQRAIGKLTGSDTAENLVVSEGVHLVVASEVEQTAGGVIGARADRVAVGEEGDGVDVGLVAVERVGALAGADVPDLGRAVARAGHEQLLRVVDRDAHHITAVVGEVHLGLAALDVPEDAGGVSGRRDDGALVKEAAAGQVAVVSRELLGRADDLGLAELLKPQRKTHRTS